MIIKIYYSFVYNKRFLLLLLMRAHVRARYPLHLDTMGLIAAALRRELEEMQQRHAETDRRVAQLIDDTRRLIADTDAMLAEDRPQ